MRSHDHPTLPADHYLWYWLHRNMGRPPRWTFPDALTGPGVSLHRLHFDNYEALWPRLAQGDTAYVEREYRERTLLYEQVVHHHGYAPYSGNHGAVDYLVLDIAQKEEGLAQPAFLGSDRSLSDAEAERLAGVVHLYDLSMERLGDGMRNPFVGIQLAEAYRGTGTADRALDVLERFVEQTYEEARGVTAMIKRENARSIRFFGRRGYAESAEYGLRKDTVFMIRELASPVSPKYNDRIKNR